MGTAPSTLLLGVHSLVELGAGIAIFITGKIPEGVAKGEAAHTSPTDRLWKRWQAAGLIALAYVGYLGLSPSTTSSKEGSDAVNKAAIQTCFLFHSAATAAMCFAKQENLLSWKELTVSNIHLYLMLGFGAAAAGLID
jgi:hypothetical protein